MLHDHPISQKKQDYKKRSGGGGWTKPIFWTTKKSSHLKKIQNFD